MPKVRPKETYDSYIKRCIPYVMAEKPGISNIAAFARCNGLWEEAKKRKDKKK